MQAEVAPFLIVEDAEDVARSLVRLFAMRRPTRLALTAREAEKILESVPQLAGIVVDVGLPDGSGLDVLERARQRFPDVPALVLTGRLERELVNRSYSLRGEYLCKPGTAADFVAFIERALASKKSEDVVSRDALDAFASESQLTTRDVAILEWVMRDTPRRELPEKLGLAPQTTKMHVRALLRRTGATNLDVLRQRILRQAIRGAVS